jgi:hypothetical protein
MNMKIRVASHIALEVKNALKYDIVFLKNNRLVDYSLLLGIYENQGYNSKYELSDA